MTTDLSSHVVARMTHDLANPLGAIGNGIELMELTGAAATPELSLIKDATTTAQARLRFMRVAFGTAAPQGQTINTIVADWNLTSKAQVHVADELPETMFQCVALMIIGCGAGLPAGGTISVACENSGVHVQATGPKTLPQDTEWTHVTQGSDLPPKAATIHFNLLRQSLQAMGRTAKYTQVGGGISVAIES